MKNFSDNDDIDELTKIEIILLTARGMKKAGTITEEQLQQFENCLLQLKSRQQDQP